MKKDTITMSSVFARTPIILNKQKVLIAVKDEHGKNTGTYKIRKRVNIPTANEMRFFMSVLSQFNPLYPNEDYTYVIDKKKIIELSGISKNLTSVELSELAASINKYSCHFKKDENISDEECRKLYNMSIFPTTIYDTDTNEITIKVNKDFAKFFWTGKIEKDVELSKMHYFTFNFENIEKLTSPYSMRMYIYLRSLSNYSSTEILLENLLSLFGIDVEDKFEYKVFKRNILNKIETEINSFTDLNIKFNETRQKRKVYKLSIDIALKSSSGKKSIESNQEDSTNDEILNKELKKHLQLDAIIDYMDSGNGNLIKTWNRRFGKASINDKELIIELLKIYYPYQIGKAIEAEYLNGKDSVIKILKSNKYGNRIENEYSSKNKKISLNNESNCEGRRIIGLKECNVSGKEIKKGIELKLGTNEPVDFDELFRRKQHISSQN